MLQIEPVSKYQKQIYCKFSKEKGKNRDQHHRPLSSPYTLQQIQKFVDCQENQEYHDRQFEDANLTKFLHEQLVLIKFTMTFLGISSILICFIQSLYVFTQDLNAVSLIVQSVISLFLIILVTAKHIKMIQLREKQLIKQKRQNKWMKWIKNTWFQSFLLILHPNDLSKNIIFQVQQPIYGTSIPLTLNRALQIVVLLRIYLLFQAILVSSIYCSPRASRMCRIYNTKQQKYFGIKSIFNSYPLHSLLVLSISQVVVLSLMLKLSQENNPNFSNYGNVIWCIIITMGTVGYGDYYPTSYLGRIIAFIAAISGIILSSLLILTLSQYLAMNSKEKKSHITLKRLQLRKILQKFAEQTIVSTSTMGFASFPGQTQDLKKKTQEVKLSLRRLKNMTDDDNLSDEITHMFEALDGNLMKIYLQQKEYTESLYLLKQREGARIQQMNFTFAGEIQNIIKDC